VAWQHITTFTPSSWATFVAHFNQALNAKMVLQSTLALVSGKIILVLRSGAIVISTVAEFSPALRQRKNIERITQCISGAMAFTIAVLGFLNVANNPYTMRGLDDRCTTADADIVGAGVLAVTWTQFVTLGFIVILGMVNPERSAIQEVGAGLLVTHIALAIALLVPAFSYQLSPVDSVLGMMILDAQNSALSIQLVTKEILASRWQTYLVLFGQAVGLATIGMLIDKFTKNGLANNECSCISAFWWGWISNCDEGHPDDHQAIWTYYALRIITVTHGGVLASLKSSSFDQAKRQEERYPCAECEGCTKGNKDCCVCVVCEECNGCRNSNAKWCPPCHDMNCASCNKELHDRPQDALDQHEAEISHVQETAKQCSPCGTNDCKSCKDWRLRSRCEKCPGIKEFREGYGWYGGFKYSQIAATTSVSFIEATLYSLFSLCAAVNLMSAYNIRPSSILKAVGQMTNIVIAAGTALRAIWVFLSSFWKLDTTETGAKRTRRETAQHISEKKDA